MRGISEIATMPHTDTKAATSRQIASAAKWGSAGTLARILIQFVAQILLVRQLGPEILGVYAVGAIVLGLAGFLVDMGIGPALIQKQQLSEHDIRFAFTLQVAIGLTFTLVLWLVAPQIAHWMKQPQAEEVVKALAWVCTINACAAVAQNLLRRNLNFKAIHLGQVLSFAIGYFAIGVPLAAHGFGVWALIGSVLAQNLIAAIWMVKALPHAMRPMLKHPEGAGSMIQFGAQAFGTNLLNWAIGNVDRMIVGRAFPGTGLGLYNTTYNLLLAPTGSAIGILQSILFPASARSQNKRELLLGFCRGGLSVAAIIVVPTFLAIAAMADPLIEVLYGPSWRQAGPVMAMFALAMIPYCLMAILTPIMWGIGRVGQEGKVQILTLAALLVLCLLAAEHSLVAVGMAVVASFVLRFMAMLHVFSKEFESTFGHLLKSLLSGLMIGIVGISMNVCVQSMFAKTTESALTEFLISGSAFLVGALLATPFALRALTPEGSQMVRNITNKFGLTRELQRFLPTTSES